MYRASISSRAKRHLKKITKETHRGAVASAIEEIRENPHIGKPLTKELVGKYSFKVGMYRIIYRIKEKDNLIEILTAGHRSNVY
ncbi:MAG: type II toxin-antitoxin system RelE/ParE family toxin [bacterium]